MLHYLKESDTQNISPNWCGAHFDHGVFTSLMPAYYFKDGVEVPEPEEAGLYIMPSNSKTYEKINATDKSVMIFQVGEFVQLASNDQIRATKHLVKKAPGNIERFTFALFFSADDNAAIHSNSELTMDARYIDNKAFNGSITYGKWEAASYERYRAV
jgi:isopenicillin N synthase-like dioxygenase